MNKIFVLSIIALAVPLASCAGDAETRAASTVAIACDNFATAIDNLASLRSRGNLTQKQIAGVDAAIADAAVICSTKSIADPVAAAASIQSAVDAINGVTSAH